MNSYGRGDDGTNIATPGYTFESYQGRPANAPVSPPNSLGTWPTGFSGRGWLVRDGEGVIVYAHAFRGDCMAWVEGRRSA